MRIFALRDKFMLADPETGEHTRQFPGGCQDCGAIPPSPGDFLLVIETPQFDGDKVGIPRCPWCWERYRVAALATMKSQGIDTTNPEGADWEKGLTLLAEMRRVALKTGMN